MSAVGACGPTAIQLYIQRQKQKPQQLQLAAQVYIVQNPLAKGHVRML